MIKTVIENKQNLIVEGCYIQFDWLKDFEGEYLDYIKYYCLIMSGNYIKSHFTNIKRYANVIENRLGDKWHTIERVLEDNAHYLVPAQKYKVNYILIDNMSEIDLDL